eukprot:6482625-Alexandrium_andersonii.AAC.1
MASLSCRGRAAAVRRDEGLGAQAKAFKSPAVLGRSAASGQHLPRAGPTGIASAASRQHIPRAGPVGIANLHCHVANGCNAAGGGLAKPPATTSLSCRGRAAVARPDEGLGAQTRARAFSFPA